MQYVLGNMLNGGGGLNADGLALDLQFAADKTLTARKGPTPVFTRASTATFVGSNGLIQSAAVNAARFDHDPVTLASRGLLIEEGRTNLFSRSEEFNETAWLKLRLSISANSTVSPSGDNSADKLVEDASNNTHMVYRVLNTGSLVAHTFSVFAKADGRNFVYLDCGDGFPLNSNAYFNLSNGTLGTIGANATASITAFGNGWYRCSVTATPTSTTANGFYIQIASASGTRSYQGDGASGIFIWGAQLEAGSFPTSYIPTVASSVVRSADVCSITGANFTSFYNQPEGTLFADVTPQVVAQVSTILAVNISTFQSAHLIYKIDSTFNVAGRRWGGQTTVLATPQTGIVTSTDVAVSRSRLAYAYKLNDFAFAASGSLIGIDTSGTVPSPTAMRIGSRDDGLSINGHLAEVRYYKKRLPNAKLAQLTV